MTMVQSEFQEIENRLKSVKEGASSSQMSVEKAQTWLEDAGQRLDQINADSDYIAFNLLELKDDEDDIVRVGEHILNELDTNNQEVIQDVDGMIGQLMKIYGNTFVSRMKSIASTVESSLKEVLADHKGDYDEEEVEEQPTPKEESVPSPQVQSPSPAKKEPEINLME